MIRLNEISHSDRRPVHLDNLNSTFLLLRNSVSEGGLDFWELKRLKSVSIEILHKVNIDHN